MDFFDVELGKFMYMTIYRHIVELDFEDYDNFILKFRGKKPDSYTFKYDSNGKPSDIVLHFKDKNGKDWEEPITFKSFTMMITQCWDWGYKNQRLRDYYTLDLKYSEIRYQIDEDKYCSFCRIYDRVNDGFYKKGEKK